VTHPLSLISLLEIKCPLTPNPVAHCNCRSRVFVVTSELLDEKGIQQYQSLIGAVQWAVSIGRIDITTAVMTLSGFRTAPRIGHLEHAKPVYRYLAKMKHAIIRV
jgi:hypothetical protein